MTVMQQAGALAIGKGAPGLVLAGELASIVQVC